MRPELTGFFALLAVGASSACGNPAAPAPPAIYSLTLSGSVGALNAASHAVTSPRAGTAQVVLTWTASDVDLDIYITSGACTAYPKTSSAAACAIQASATSASGVREQVGFTATADQSFKIWVDNFSPASATYAVAVTVQ